ncbi:MAG: hypothetical protein ACREBS_11690 [Nitrososphaerales archaeon]
MNQKVLQQKQESETVEQEEKMMEPGLATPFCETNLNFVHNELLYILHPRMQIGESVYIENAP